MKISTKGRYAIKVMVDLAEHYGQGYISLQDIATRQEISEKYLENIIRSLVAENLLEGQRGKGGGYKLCRKPEEYNIGEVLEMMEGRMAAVSCLATEENLCPRASRCGTLPMWSEFDKMVHDLFYSKKLSDLIKKQPAV